MLDESYVDALLKMLEKEWVIESGVTMLSDKEGYVDCIEDQSELLRKAMVTNDEAQRNQILESWSEYIMKCVNESPDARIEFRRNPSFWSKNVENIKSIMRIIQQNGYHGSWDNNWFAQEKFKEMCCIPIYIPDVCPFIISGIYFIFLLHGKEISFASFLFSEDIRTEKSDDIGERKYKESKEKRRREKYERIARTDLKRLEKIFGIVVKKNTNNPHYDDIIELCGMYRYCVKESRAFKQARRNLQLTSYLFITGMPMTNSLDEEQKRILLFKTLLWMRISDENRSMYRAFCNYLNDWGKILQLIREYRIYKSEKLYLDFNLKNSRICQDHVAYWRQISTREISKKGNTTLEYSSDTDNLFFVILWKMLLMEFYWLKFDDAYWEILFVRNNDNASKGGVPSIPLFTSDFTWCEFYEKYKSFLDIVFEGINSSLLKRAWHIAWKVLVHMEPGRFNFEVAEDPVTRMDSAAEMNSEWWYQIHKPSSEFYLLDDSEILSNSVKFEEIFSLMYMYIKLENFKVKTWWLPTNGKAKSKIPTIGFMLKNIAHYYSSDLILRIRLILDDIRLLFRCPQDEIENIRIEKDFLHEKTSFLINNSKTIEDAKEELNDIIKVLKDDPFILLK